MNLDAASVARAVTLMAPEERAELDALLSASMRDSGEAVETYLFDRQRALYRDPHRFITACCGRRGGKTVGVAAMMLAAAKKHAGRVVLYLTLTRGDAKLIIWPTLKLLNEQFSLGGETNESDLTMTMPNGAVIVLAGVDKRKEIEKRRGLGLALVVIDECQSIPEYVRSLVNDVLAPALMDVPGRLVMIGTPSLIASGYWYECHHSRSDVWGHHSWIFRENPMLPDPDGSLAAELARRGVTEDDTSIQREWFARWIRDALSAVFAFDPAKNTYATLPLLRPELWEYVISVDIGGGVEKDSDAISVLAFHAQAKGTWLTEEHVSPKMDVTDLATKVSEIRDRLGAQRVVAIVADTGGIGAKVAQEMRKRYSLEAVAAKKADKWANIELLNASCRHGEFYARADSAFAMESVKVEKDWTKSTPDRIAIKGHMPDICDSVLYGYVESLSWLSELPPPPPPARGTEAWAKREAEEMEKAALEDFEARQEAKADAGWEDGWGR